MNTYAGKYASASSRTFARPHLRLRGSMVLQAARSRPHPYPDAGCPDALRYGRLHRRRDSISRREQRRRLPAASVPTGLAAPAFVAIDASGNIYVTNTCNGTITIYAKGSSGNVSPSAIIGGSNTGLNGPTGVAVDSSGKVYVANYKSGGSVTIYAAGSNGNVSPSAAISGSNTGFNIPQGVALDSSGKIYVTSGNGGPSNLGSVAVFPAGSNGNVTPITTISGSNTGLNGPVGIALDSSNNIYVVNYNNSSVKVYPAGSNGNVSHEGPAHHHRRSTRADLPQRHRAGFQRQHLCQQRIQRRGVCLSVARQAALGETA